MSVLAATCLANNWPARDRPNLINARFAMFAGRDGSTYRSAIHVMLGLRVQVVAGWFRLGRTTTGTGLCRTILVPFEPGNTRAIARPSTLSLANVSRECDAQLGGALGERVSQYVGEPVDGPVDLRLGDHQGWRETQG